jgi:hypothetical protein
LASRFRLSEVAFVIPVITAATIWSSQRETVAVAAVVLRRQRQPHQRLHRPVGAQHRIGQLEQRIGPGCEAPVQLPAEPRQPLPRLIGPAPVASLRPRHTESHGHRPDYRSSVEGTRR